MALGGVAVQVDKIDFPRDAQVQPLAQGQQLLPLRLALFQDDLRRFAEPDDPGNVQSARAHPPLVAAAVNDGGQPHAGFPAPDVEGADAFGAVNLVGGEGGKVNVHLLHVNIHVAHALGGIRVEQHPFLAGDFADLLQRVDGPDLVVGRHQGHQDGLVGDGVGQLIEVNRAVLVHRQEGHLEPPLLQHVAGVQNRLVLDLAGDDVVALFLEEFRHAGQGQVVRFGRAAGQDDLLFGRADQRGDLPPRLLYAFLRFPPEGVVAAGRVAELIGEVGQHRLQHPWVHRGGGVVIHVQGRFHFHPS